MPLAFIFFITAIKDFFEDYKKIRSDRDENNQKVNVFDNISQTFKQICCKQLHPGHIIKVYKDQYFPSDLILIFSSELTGYCYVETKNIDGETNLKLKLADKKIKKHIPSEDFLNKEHLIVNYEKPNSIIYRFSGNILAKNGDEIPLGAQNLVLRGSSLKNIDYVIGLVAYTGHNCKIMCNVMKANLKKSKLELKTTNFIFQIFFIQISICIICSITYIIWYHLNENKLGYLHIQKNEIQFEDNNFLNFFLRFGNWVLICTNIIPSSLLVTIEMVKFIQGINISNDKNADYPLVYKSNLNEELGQINYIFSDKTGTLTKNIMEFKKIVIGSTVYGQENEQLTDEEVNREFPKVEHVNFRDKKFINIVKQPNHPEHMQIIHILFILAQCHTVNSNIDLQGNTSYSSSSPDEIAIVNFTKFVGVQFMKIDEDNNIIIKFNNTDYTFELLHVFEFNSDRKRQSIIVKNHKGKAFGLKGLRTLMFAQKQINENEYIQWKQQLDSVQQNSQNVLYDVFILYDQLERDLNILGAVAIEDKLQDDVPEIITSFKNVGIQVWILTGDKIEIAINVAYSCNLLDNYLKKIIIDLDEENELQNFLLEQLKILENENNQNSQEEYEQIQLIIIYMQILYVLIQKKLLKIIKYCKCVLCCRVSPIQKQQVVNIIRQNDSLSTTLAIGDGANDVNMITAAHLGVGIIGIEGQQASRAADYSIKEFRHLRSLLFYHGRECYRRNSDLINYMFFKNILLIMPQFWYGLTNYLSGQTLYDSILYQFYNIIFTSLPIIVYATCDQEYSERELLSNEKKNYYQQGINNELFNSKIFWKSFISATIQGGIITMISLFAFEINFVNEEGRQQHFWATGIMVFGLNIIVSNIRVIIITNEYSFWFFICIIGSILSFFFALLVTNQIIYSDVYFSFYQVFSSFNFYAGYFLAICATSLFDLGIFLYSSRNGVINIDSSNKTGLLSSPLDKKT
ncbi:hypothetical protein IMG5_206852 [Ichthyophthirius multifiliis]|uniref:P-type sodium-transporting ATPase4 n=1 Tax=Ichthyophthirius multifiliis TaxID=5932 RepID=G0QNK3_ICHMU|nr:hypothetical protein IMG5_206852 [Ichthyophthirius multifiliis]EGR33192.1 hypothetical protein IMG5_206852 [Ichthyophthirius multifiliis]|eukprot:XP_004037178.1 hypothetical protein IMG5_206852 [Ichthyophthirius multifiliis]